MLKKSSDVSDATIVAEVVSAASPSQTSSASPETLKPVGDVDAGAARYNSTAANPKKPTIKARIQQTIAAALLGVAHKAVNKAVNNAANNAANGGFKPRPNWAFATQSSAHLIALGFGSGLMRPAPGTWGTVFAWVTFNYLLAGLSTTTLGIVIAAAFVIGVWACGAAGKALGVIDHGAWVWDEVVAFWLVLWLIPTGFVVQIWAFVLFRFFDIVKPPPIRQWDARLKSGFGVMWDDIVAAFYTLLVIALWMRVFG